MGRKILLPLDGSSFAEAAAPYAVSIAEKSEAEITLALVHPSLPAVTESSHPELIEWARRGEQGYLDDAATRLFEGTDIAVTKTLLTGDPAGRASQARGRPAGRPGRHVYQRVGPRQPALDR